MVGLKPGFAELPTDGVVPLSGTLDHVGPLAQSVSDAAHLFHALTGVTRRMPDETGPDGLRLAMPGGYFCDLLDREVRAQFEEALRALRAAGVIVEEVNVPHASEIAPVYLHIVLVEAAAYHAATLEAMPDRYTPPVRLRLEMGRYVLAEDYARALAGRDLLRHEVDAALEGRDALVLPTLPIPAPVLGASVVEIDGRTEPVRNVMLRLTQIFNLTGHPAISVPCGRTSAGLPCGLQLAGARGRTDALLGVARSCELVLDQPARRVAESR
jgi:aspartyl-tRNA(Asn)/glutamyl-tRNA(Gln) amidotransferase subunit A